jgi:hypothetical protein
MRIRIPSTAAWAVLAGAMLLSTGQPLRAQTERDPFFSEGPRSSVSRPAEPDDSWGRDPFNRPFDGAAAQTQAAPARGKKLTGIIFGGEVRLAIIGGETVGVGATLGDQKVADIRRRSIVLTDGAGVSEEVFLEDFSIRK